MSEDEQAALKAWRDRQAFSAIILLAIIAPTCLGLAVMAVLRSDTFFTSPAMVFLPVALLWAWLLRRAPLRWLRAGQDQREGQVTRVHGPAAINGRPGIGLVAPTKFELRVAGQCFELPTPSAEALIPGQAYSVKYAPLSRAILSIRAETGSMSVEPADPALAASLTPRDRELIRLIAAGLTDKAIARELNLSPATVRSYNSALYEKLHIQRRTQVRAAAEALGMALD